MVEHDLQFDALSLAPQSPPAPPRGEVELIVDAEHFERVVLDQMLTATVSLDIATADFKAMLAPDGKKQGKSRGGSGRGRRRRAAPSIVIKLVELAEAGVEVRLLHAGVPSGPALNELKKAMNGSTIDGLTIRRCPRLHAKAVIVDSRWLYMGSANLTGAGMGAKAAHRRNFEWGICSESGDLIDGVLQQFNALWLGEPCDGCGRKDVCPVPLEEPDLG